MIIVKYCMIKKFGSKKFGEKAAAKDW